LPLQQGSTQSDRNTTATSVKHISSIEFGRLLGIDKIPEAKSVRVRLNDISDQKKSSQWMKYLFHWWLDTQNEHGFLFYEIVLQICKQVSNHISKETLEADPDLPLFTMIFDREGYYPKYFQELWQERIAVITYRKNVKDKWDEDAFKDHEVEVEGDKIEMKLCEKQIELDGVPMREIRKLNEDGHQNSVITTNKKLS
jgi:hypothetical protein